MDIEVEEKLWKQKMIFEGYLLNWTTVLFPRTFFQHQRDELSFSSGARFDGDMSKFKNRFRVIPLNLLFLV